MVVPVDQSSERRSSADLQQILDSLIGDAGFVLSGNLPDVLMTYEAKHKLVILDPSEYQGLRELCSNHSDMELGPTELFTFLSMIQKPLSGTSTTESGPLTHSVSMPPGSFQANELQSTPKQPITSRRRRESDRIRSPSDSSSSSSDDDRTEPERRRMDRQMSEPVRTKVFPSSSTTFPLPNSRPLAPTRIKKLSDPSRFNNSPLSARGMRPGIGPPSAFGNAGGFSRPSPATRRRRRSSGAYTSDNDDSRRSDYGEPKFERSISSNSVALSMTSPTWPEHESHPSSPISPGVDHTSFHFRAKSPEEMGDDEIRAAEAEMNGGGSVTDDQEDEVDEADDVVGEGALGLGAETINPRLSRISTDSVTSLRTSHDKLQALQKQNSELLRKLKESERQLSLLGADNDRLVVDLEKQLEEARHELAQKRKEDKDLRGKELNQNIQISGLEADLANVQRSLEQSKEHRANMQKMYDSQCDEAQRLREMLRDRDAEIHQLEESMQEHEADEEKFTREIQSLEAEVKRLEADLVVARRAESVLETQKQENLQLKETIDRMRFDLNEARATAASASKGGHGRVSTNGSSAGGTLSRNLGDEINRRLMDAEVVTEHEDEGSSYVETVVRTQRTRKVGSRATSNSKGTDKPDIPAIHLEEAIREYADVSTATDPVEVIPLAGPSKQSSLQNEHPPAYTAQPDFLNPQEVLDRAHPRGPGDEGIVDEEYEVLVESLGLRCNVLEEELNNRRAEREKLGLVPPIMSQGRSHYSKKKVYSRTGVINNIIYTTQDNVGKVAGWTLAAFVVGIVAGAHFAHVPSGIHPRDYQMFAHMNDLARSVGAGEGILPHGARGLVGVLGMGAGVLGRIPT